MYNPFSLEGKTILVTGASSGIGQSTAIECSKMGAALVITGRNAERLQDTFNQLEGVGHKQIVADLSNQDGIDTLVASLPKLEGAVLCAGIGMTKPIQFSDREKFDKIFNTNLFSNAEISRLLFKKKILKSLSSLVFIVSVGGILTFHYGNAIYGASKAALNSFMKFCALEFASRKIRVNSVCPGMIETPLTAPSVISEEQHEIYKKRYIIQRYGKPEEVAYAAIYLLSDASSWVTNTSLVVNGGGIKL